MTPLPEPLPIRTVAEAYFYLMLQTCGDCGHAPLTGDNGQPEFSEGRACRRVVAACGRCGAKREVVFDVSACPSAGASLVSSRDSAPSRIIDCGQWLALFHTILRAVGGRADASDARQLGLEAAECLDEALKFYDPAEELPGPDAFLTPQAYETSRAHPEPFRRSRLLAYRDKLPGLRAMRERVLHDGATVPTVRPWWRRWLGRR